MTEVSANAKVVITLQYINVSSQHGTYLKFTQSYISILSTKNIKVTIKKKKRKSIP